MVRAEVRLGLGTVKGRGVLPTTSHSIFNCRVGQTDILVVVNHKSGRILISNSLGFITVHGKVRVRVRVRVRVTVTVTVTIGVRVRVRVRVRLRLRLGGGGGGGGSGLGLGLCLGLGFDLFLSNRSGDRTRATVFVTSRRYHQTNSAQALKETNRWTRSIPWIHAHTQRCHDSTTLTLYI